jgi:hypothetical protein
MGLSGIASAKPTKAAKGTPAWCLTHHKNAACRAGAAGTGGSTGGPPPPQITVEVDPNPLVETGESEIHAVIQVETSPSYAGDAVNIDSSQLTSSCIGNVTFENLQVDPQTVPPSRHMGLDRIDAILDDDGNATVVVDASDCAPGTSVIEADLEVAPFLTALTTLVALPPAVTPEGVSAYPQIGNISEEVETGDTSTSGDSDVYAVFYVETSPVYAEQTVEIESSQLEGRCLRGWLWEPGNANGVGVGAGFSGVVPGTGINQGPKPSTILDDDGNAVFVFKGVSCASGTSEVIADVDAGTHPTYTASFTVLPPQPTVPGSGGGSGGGGG